MNQQTTPMSENNASAPVEAPVEAPVQTELTEHEIKVLKGRRANWYRDQLTYMKPEAEYHEMLARIENAKADTYEAQYRQARAFASVDAARRASEQAEVAPTAEPQSEPLPDAPSENPVDTMVTD